jgi:hypothetical protein
VRELGGFHIGRIGAHLKERFPTEKEQDYGWAKKDPMGQFYVLFSNLSCEPSGELRCALLHPRAPLNPPQSARNRQPPPAR